MSESKLRLWRWRFGWKHERAVGLSFSRLTCGCWRFWIGRFFLGHKCW